MKDNKVSFIILNYNTPQLTKDCVESIEKYYGDKEHEVVIVDNNSKKESLDILLSLLDGASYKLVRSRINAGFGLGNMLGAFQAEGDYYCFLNSDVQLVEDCVTPLVQYLSEHTEVGTMTPQQYRPDGSPSFSFRHELGLRHAIFGDRIFEWLFPGKYPSRSNFSRTEPFAVPEINGCFMFFPADVFWQIGGFDTNIFLYHEEYDIAQRLKRLGYKNVVHPAVRFLHCRGASSNVQKKEIRKERFISKIYGYSKYHSPLMTLLLCLQQFVTKALNPKNWFLIPVFLGGQTLSRSMRPSVRGYLKNKK
ncbi:MAG: glycosyltransferase family 2 protein [Bacteroidaceae bacterium]|nr:glycosyltransferase family 2 protein [Bacteroidaceae bacterium]